MKTETTISSEQIYTGRVINLRVDTVRLPDGKTTKREIIEHRGAVAMVPVAQNGHVVLVKQFRKAAEQVMIEIPAGTLEKGEEPLACARRELAEETGFSAASIEPLTDFFPVPGYSTEHIYLYLATGLQTAASGGDEDEDIEVLTLPLDQALALIGTGEIHDAKTIIGLLLYARRIAA